MFRTRPTFVFRVILTTAILGMSGAIPRADAQDMVIVDEQFNGDAVDTSVFTFSGSGDESFFGRTQLNSPQLPGPFDAPTVANGVLQLEINSYNPFSPGRFFLADEIRTIQEFAPTPDFGFSFETRARFVDDATNPLAPGLIGGAFLFGVDTTASPLVRDEVDFELLSNFPNDIIFTNIFNDDNFSSAGNFQVASVPGLDLTEFNDYRIETTIFSTEFFVNDQLIRTDITDLAIDPQDFRLNINAQGPEFEAAFSDEIQPTANPAENETFIFEVDSLVISEIDPGELPPPPPPSPVVYQDTLLDGDSVLGSLSSLTDPNDPATAEFYSIFGLQGEEVTITVEGRENDFIAGLVVLEGLFEDFAEFDDETIMSRLLFVEDGNLFTAPDGFGPFVDPSITFNLPTEGIGAYTLAVVNLEPGIDAGGDGQLNFTISASGNLLPDPTAVPEPSSAIVLSIGSLTLLRRRRQAVA